MFDHATLLGHFPFPSIRPAQADALEKLARTTQEGKSFTMIEAPTGFGKSPLAMAAGLAAAGLPPEGDYRPGAYITTTQIILQAQYMRDFADRGLRELKGKANYMCAHFDGGGVIDCASSSALHTSEEDKCGACTYKIAQASFKSAPVGVTNLSYYTTTRKFIGDHAMPPRRLLILDECHNTEAELIGFGEVDVTPFRLERLGLSKPPTIRPEWTETQKASVAKAWLHATLLPVVIKSRVSLMAEAEELRKDGDHRRMAQKVKQAQGMDQFMSKIQHYLDAPDDEPWVIFNTTSPKGAIEGLTLKPLYADHLADELLFSSCQHVLMLSATILGPRVLARNLGIKEGTFGFKGYGSDFPVENRLVNFTPVGSMGFKSIDKTLPKLVAEVEKICNDHPTSKGLIHTNSYKVTTAVKEHLTQAGLGKRLITHTSDKGSRDQAVKTHIESPEPTILISPSLTEGLDLAGDLSRWQIITKTPYPSLGDAWIKARMDLDPEWYAWRTVLTMVQATGRSIRSKDDFAETYILDGDFDRLLTRNGHLFPKWWKSALVL